MVFLEILSGYGSCGKYLTINDLSIKRMFMFEDIEVKKNVRMKCESKPNKVKLNAYTCGHLGF